MLGNVTLEGAHNCKIYIFFSEIVSIGHKTRLLDDIAAVKLGGWGNNELILTENIEFLYKHENIEAPITAMNGAVLNSLGKKGY